MHKNYSLSRHLAPALAVAVLLGFCSCRRGSSSHLGASNIDAIAQSYVRLTVALGERDADSLDFAVVPDSLREEVRKSYPTIHEIREQSDELEQQLRMLHVTPEQQTRAEFLTAQLEAMSARAAMLQGGRLDFDSEARALFETGRLPDTRATERRNLQKDIAALLPPKNSKEGEVQRYASYSRQFVIPSAKLLPVMNAALRLCREHTVAHIELPVNESVELQLVRDRPWAAFSRYAGHAHSVIMLNMDMAMTVDDALELACHEGYPGHHVFNTLRDFSLVQQGKLPEAGVQPTFSPQSYVSEAAAAYAPELAFTPEDRAKALRDVLMPLAGLPNAEAARLENVDRLVRKLDSAEPAIARDYVDGRLEFVRAEQALANEALMAESENVLLYLNEYRSYMLAYTDGPRRIEAELAACPTVEAKWKAYESMMRTMKFRLDAPVSTDAAN